MNVLVWYARVIPMSAPTLAGFIGYLISRMEGDEPATPPTNGEIFAAKRQRVIDSVRRAGWMRKADIVKTWRAIYGWGHSSAFTIYIRIGQMIDQGIFRWNEEETLLCAPDDPNPEPWHRRKILQTARSYLDRVWETDAPRCYESQKEMAVYGRIVRRWRSHRFKGYTRGERIRAFRMAVDRAGNGMGKRWVLDLLATIEGASELLTI